MNMAGLSRALRYFVRQAEVYVVCIFAGSFAVALYQRFVAGGSLAFKEVLQSVPGMAVCLTAAIILTNGMSAGQMWHSMLISVGCRRKNVFIGSLVMNMLIIFESLIFLEVLFQLLHFSGYGWIMPLLTAFYFFVEGLSQLAGIAVMKWGKTVYVVSIIVFVFGCVIVGMLMVIVFDEANIKTEFLSEAVNSRQRWWAVLIGILTCAVANIVGYRILRRYEVKL